MTVKQAKPLKQLNTKVTESMYKKIGIYAAVRGQSVQDLIAESLEHYFGVIESEVSSELKRVA